MTKQANNIVKIIFAFLVVMACYSHTHKAYAKYEIFPPVDTPTVGCSFSCKSCDLSASSCEPVIRKNHKFIRDYMSEQFRYHRDWMIDTYFIENILYAMAQMTSQMTAVAMQQMKILGTFFDAKHQLETQRLFQQLMAEAHKDYQPSEGMCDIGTTVRGLLATNRKSDTTHQTFANRIMDRQLRTGENLTINTNSDLKSRVDMFKKTFCSKRNNSDGLHNICFGATAPNETINRDVDYTRSVENKLTLGIEFNDGEVTADEKSAFALMSNLFANDIMPSISNRLLADGNGNPKEAAYEYLKLRAVAAKRSVAQNSISAIIAERMNGDNATEYAPFLKSVIVELGVPKEKASYALGATPSYFSQMEVLTKKVYQNPVFYTELYDKPANVLRKRAAIRAIGLIQDRDFYKSQLRSEAVLSVLLESMLSEEHDRVYRDLNDLKKGGDAAHE